MHPAVQRRRLYNHSETRNLLALSLRSHWFGVAGWMEVQLDRVSMESQETFDSYNPVLFADLVTLSAAEMQCIFVVPTNSRHINVRL